MRDFNILRIMWLISFIQLVFCNSYCDYLCKDPRQRNDCMNLKSTSGWRCYANVKDSDLNKNKSLIDNILKVHNAFRENNHLKWDTDLSDAAQRWAHICPDEKEKDPCRNQDEFPGKVYQNIMEQQWVNPLTTPVFDIDAAIKKWWEEDKKRPGPNNSNYLKTSRVGCGFTETDKCLSRWPLSCEQRYGAYFVCNYAADSS